MERAHPGHPEVARRGAGGARRGRRRQRDEHAAKIQAALCRGAGHPRHRAQGRGRRAAAPGRCRARPRPARLVRAAQAGDGAGRPPRPPAAPAEVADLADRRSPSGSSRRASTTPTTAAIVRRRHRARIGSEELKLHARRRKRDGPPRTPRRSSRRRAKAGSSEAARPRARRASADVSAGRPAGRRRARPAVDQAGGAPSGRARRSPSAAGCGKLVQDFVGPRRRARARIDHLREHGGQPIATLVDERAGPRSGARCAPRRVALTDDEKRQLAARSRPGELGKQVILEETVDPIAPGRLRRPGRQLSSSTAVSTGSSARMRERLARG